MFFSMITYCAQIFSEEKHNLIHLLSVKFWQFIRNMKNYYFYIKINENIAVFFCKLVL